MDFVAASLKNFRVTLQRGKNNSFAAEPLECCFRLFSSTNSPTYIIYIVITYFPFPHTVWGLLPV